MGLFLSDEFSYNFEDYSRAVSGTKRKSGKSQDKVSYGSNLENSSLENCVLHFFRYTKAIV